MNIRLMDPEKILEILSNVDGQIFSGIRRLTKIPSKELSEILQKLLFFNLISQDEQIYHINFDNVQLWAKYNYCYDFTKLERVQKLKKKFEDMGINMDLDGDDDEIY